MTDISYVPRRQFEAALRLDDRADRAALVADLCRINALYMVMRAGSGHIGSSFSSLDIVAWTYLEELDVLNHLDNAEQRGIYFSSKGHDAPGLYAFLIAIGALDERLLHELRRFGGLPGHPDVATPWIEANTGSLGMGISKAKGMAEARRLLSRSVPIFVMTGDGELQEGQIWESLQGAANRQLGEITVIVDHNKIQSDTWVEDVSALGDIERRFAASGWAVARCDGHDVHALGEAIATARKDPAVPGVVIADTVKGRGVSFMESGMDEAGFYKFHSGAPAPEIYHRALEELQGRADNRLRAAGLPALGLETVSVPERSTPPGASLVAAYGTALCERAARDERIVALDADLVLDTGLIPFSRQFPDRFVECGIAEQDMVSQAGGMALQGLVPVVHSFACFLAPRANEQMHTNATEGTKVVYVGSLAGVIPGGPGHSHQMVRDISVMSSQPGLTAAEPSCAAEVGPLLDALLDDVTGPAYLRLVTPPIVVPFSLPDAYRPVVGRGVAVGGETDATVALIGAGPVVLTSAMGAAERLNAQGVATRVFNLPWLNTIDARWLDDVLTAHEAIIVIDNHARAGGQGQMVLAAIAAAKRPRRSLGIAVDGVPACGTNDEVLRAHGLDAAGIERSILTWLETHPTS